MEGSPSGGDGERGASPARVREEAGPALAAEDGKLETKGAAWGNCSSGCRWWMELCEPGPYQSLGPRLLLAGIIPQARYAVKRY